MIEPPFLPPMRCRAPRDMLAAAIRERLEEMPADSIRAQALRAMVDGLSDRPAERAYATP